MEVIIPNINIVRLEYATIQRGFHIGTIGRKRESVIPEWKIIAEEIDEVDANKFIDFIEKKYELGRKTGRCPEIDVVLLELHLFFKLKNVSRKLANR